MRRYQIDVLVVGGGGSGLMAAYSASKRAVKVALVNKGKVQRTGVTIMAPGAIAAVGDYWKKDEDSKKLHFKDTVEGGSYINNQALVQLMAEKSPDLILELERMGALFQREADGTHYVLRIDGGHTYARCPFLEDRTGKEMVKAMNSAVQKRNVAIYEDIMITRILIQDGVVYGAAGICTKTAEPVIFEAKSVILATGGGGTVYENTDNSIDMTGDGYALALRAGATLRDMEFVQFFPIGLLFPPALKGMLGGLLLYSRLYNAKGERFLEKYDPERLEQSTRDRIARAIIQEVREGRGSPRGGVYMDLTFHESGFIAKMTPALYATYQNIGIDPEKDRLEVVPTAHFMMGGIDVGEDWGSLVTGLFGAGETCGGLHGGNRLSQNALAEVMVSGDIAGRNAAKFAENTVRRFVDPVEAEKEEKEVDMLLQSTDGIEPHQIKQKLKHLMWEKVGVVRNEVQLKEAYDDIMALSQEKIFIRDKTKSCNREIVEAIEAKNMLLMARAIILSALERKESRGAHYREDYPEQDDKNLKTILIKKNGDKLECASRSIVPAIIEEGGQ